MYVLRINGQEYKSISTWSELKLNQAEAIYNIPMPEKLREYYNSLFKEDSKLPEFTIEELEKELPLYYGKIICALSDIPSEVMDVTQRLSREELYRYKVENGLSPMFIVLGLLNYPSEFILDHISSFDWKGEKLLMPETKKILGIERPLAGETAITFCESADLLINAEKIKQGKYKSMANVISILCRPRGEVYDEQVSLKRAKTMGDLPMNIVWEVFFCLKPDSNTLAELIQTSLKAAV